MSDHTAFIERLVELAGELPRETAVLALHEQPEAWKLGLSRAYQLSESLGWKVHQEETPRRRATTLLRDPEQGRITVFRESGAVSVHSSIAPFDELFDHDPGDESLTSNLSRRLDGLGLAAPQSETERLSFERLWRIRAAGSDAKGTVSDPVLCRAVGAFRHSVRDLPVLGRASAHVEMTGHGNISSMSTMLRTPRDHESQVVTTVKPRDPYEAAAEVASRVARILGSQKFGAEVTAESFSFGYLSLGRRRAQAVLTPFFVATVTIEGDQTRSAHVVPVAGSHERFIKLPRGSAAAGPVRKPSRIAVAS